ncbi:MAG: SGNH/GDSL hydrolase family protein [Planctomycetaceae bacterium]
MVSLRPVTASKPAAKWRWLFRLFAVSLGLFLGLIVAEISLRFARVGYPLLYQPDPFCGSRLAPGASGVWITEGFGHVSINSLGFRGPEVSAAKSDDVYRIAVLGDSFIEALQVDEPFTFRSQLEQQLNSSRKPGDRRYEVINAGVSGYGTAQELQMLRHYVLPLKPDAVLLAFFPENDIRNNSRRLEGDAARPYFALAANGDLLLDESFKESKSWTAASSRYERFKARVVNRSRLLQTLRSGKMKLVHGEAAADVNDVEQVLQSFVENADYAYRSSSVSDHVAAWEVTLRLIDEMADECDRHGAAFSVFTVSTAVQVHPDQKLRDRIAPHGGLDSLFYAEDRVAANCEKRSIAFFPLASKLQTEADASGDYLHGFDNTALGLGHWNTRGHAVAAEFVAEWLMRNGR